MPDLLVSFQATDLQFMSNKLKIDLTHNKIEHILLREAELVASSQKTPRDVIILVGNNPIICDCSIYDFLRYIEGRMHPYVQNFFHIIPEYLSCRGPKWLENVQVTDLHSKTLKCMTKEANYNIPCPQECECILRPEDKDLKIDCSARNFTHVPNDVKDPGEPFKLGLDFSENMLKKMPNLAKLNLQSAKLLNLSNNNISDVSMDGLPEGVKVREFVIFRLNIDSNKFLITRQILFFRSWNFTIITSRGYVLTC